jgi:hypothetical protein
MNGDGLFTIRDIWAIMEFIWFYPAKVAIPYIEKHGQIYNFLELNCTNGFSTGWVFLTAVLWIILIFLLGSLLAMIQTFIFRTHWRK